MSDIFLFNPCEGNLPKPAIYFRNNPPGNPLRVYAVGPDDAFPELSMIDFARGITASLDVANIPTRPTIENEYIPFRTDNSVNLNFGASYLAAVDLILKKRDSDESSLLLMTDEFTGGDAFCPATASVGYTYLANTIQVRDVLNTHDAMRSPGRGYFLKMPPVDHNFHFSKDIPVEYLHRQ